MRTRAQDPPAPDDSAQDAGVEQQQQQQQQQRSQRPASPSAASSTRSNRFFADEDHSSAAASLKSPGSNAAALASSAPASLISSPPTASPQQPSTPTIVISPPSSTPASIYSPTLQPTNDDAHRHSRRESKKVLAAEASKGVRSRRSIDESSDSRAWSSSSPTKPRSSQRRLSPTKGSGEKQDSSRDVVSRGSPPRRSQSPWACSPLTLLATFAAAGIAFLIVQSFLTRLFDFDPKGCAMSMMRPAFAKFSDFDTEHTRFASKYSLYLYREGGIDEDTRVKGVPVLFIPGNAGSYKQVRPLAAQAAVHFRDRLQNHPDALLNGKRPLDFFSVDLNEDITAFHGQTMLDQAEYLNEAVAYILSLYHNPNRALRDPELPDPSSVLIVGHSMGGVVARAMLTMPNYQANTVNTIITLAAPHARAPVSFDSDIVRTYNQINDYWRKSYSERWANNNPLWHVTLVSISGGGLDTVVPSDYAALSSIVPPTHGFTVFTSTIPTVWTSMDHLAITWCDQLRKSIVPALYDIIDVSRSTQTRPRAERMSVFKKAFLTGMETIAEKALPHQEPKSLLTLEDESNTMVAQGERLVIRRFEGAPKPKAYLLPIPPTDSPDQKRFTLLTDRKLNAANGDVEVMFCSVFHLHVGSASSVFAMDIQMTGNSSGSTRLACKDAGVDVTQLPASNAHSKFPFENSEPYSYLQYSLEQLSEHQFVAVVDRGSHPRHGWLVAEFSSLSDTDVTIQESLRTLLLSGTTVSFPPTRPMMTSLRIPSIESSLLTYRLSVSKPACRTNAELFSPLLRQYISEPYESKYFVNVKTADIALHGVAPYLPQPLRHSGADRGITLQLWSDSSCDSSMDVSLKIDAFGSLGKLWMRYRTVFAAFPLIVVAIVLRKQFKIYDQSGIFISFAEATDHCLRTSIPMLVLALTLFAMSTSRHSAQRSAQAMQDVLSLKANATASLLDFSKNDLLLGSSDSFFWFLLPMFALLSVGICIFVNYTLLFVIHIISISCNRISQLFFRSSDPRNNHNVFVVSSLQKRVITTGVLLLLVSTVIPYQFVFIVLCLVQMATCVRALGLARETNASANVNFFNYVHSVLLLMVWILPINVPTLIVWVHNLAVHWLTPFSSHHNILSIMPFVFVVEMLSTGKMVPRVVAWAVSQSTSVLLFGVACGAAIYGVSYAYLLHYWVNLTFVWLTILHMSSSERVDWKAIRSSLGIAEGEPAVVPGERVQRGPDVKKRP